MKRLLIASVFLLCIPLVGAEQLNFLGGIRYSMGTWEGRNNAPDGSQFKTNAGQLSLNAGYQKGQWFGTIGLGLSGYEFSDVSPDFAPDSNYQNLGSTRVQLGEIDLGFGYRVWPRLYPIFGFKRFGMTYPDSFENTLVKEYGGYAVGLAGNVPLGRRFLLFGSLVGESMNITVNNTDIGDATGVAIEWGAAYYFSSKSLLSLSLEAHTLEDKYINSNKQTHGIGTLTIGYQRRFGR